MQIQSRPPKFDLRAHLLDNPRLLNEENMALIRELFGGGPHPDQWHLGIWATLTPGERTGEYTVIMAAFQVPADYKPTYNWARAIYELAQELEAVVNRGLAVGTMVKSRRHGYIGKILEINDRGKVLVEGRKNFCTARDYDPA